MKNNLKFLTAFALLSMGAVNAQTGVGNTAPKATLDVTGTPATVTTADGIIAPRLTGDQLAAKTAYGADQTGAQVYVTAAATTPAGATVNVTAPGYYHFDGAVWISAAASAAASEPWYNVATGTGATANTQDIYQMGKVGIGTTDLSNSAFHLEKTVSTTGLYNSNFTEIFTTADAANQGIIIATSSGVEHLGSGTVNQLRAFSGGVTNSSTGNITGEATGIDTGVQNLDGSTGNIANARASKQTVKNAGSGTMNSAIGSDIVVQNVGAGTIENAFGSYIQVVNQGTGVNINAYGIHIGAVQGTNKWSLYAGDTNAPSFFAGNVCIGTTASVYPFQVAKVGNPGSGLAVDWNSAIPGSGSTDFYSYGQGAQGGFTFNSFSANGTNYPTTGSQALMRLSGTGDVGIGTTTPTAKLDVTGYIKVGSSDATGDAAPSPGMIRYNTTTNKFEGYVGGGTPGWVELN